MFFQRLCFSKPHLLLNVEYRVGNIDAVTLYAEDATGNKQDMGKQVVAEGYALVEKRREARLQPLVIQ